VVRIIIRIQIDYHYHLTPTFSFLHNTVMMWQMTLLIPPPPLLTYNTTIILQFHTHLWSFFIVWSLHVCSFCHDDEC
jgi:hypothetical protein